MEELNLITTDAQGTSVVSARELHTFLDVKSRFNDWIKNRIIKYGFQEDTDYVTLTKNLVSGGIETDYALTVNMAKELAMVERNEKGKQARQYFIAAEKIALQLVKQVAAPAPAVVDQTLLTVLAQQTQLLSDQQQAIHQLRADINTIMAGGKPPRVSRSQPGALPTSAGRSGQQIDLPGLPTGPAVAPHLRGAVSLRQSINQRVNVYAERNGASHHETYTYLYKRLFEVYGVNVYRLIRKPGDSVLDTLERYGHMDRLY